MAGRLTAEQIKKLSPEERRKRNKKLAYIRARAEARRKGKLKPKGSKTRASVKKESREVADAANRAKKIAHLAEELDSVYEREQQLLASIRELLD